MSEPVKRPTKYGDVVFDSEEHYQRFLAQSADASHDTLLKDAKPIVHVRAEERSDGSIVGKIDERDAKQHMRGQEAMQKLVMETAVARVDPGTGINAEEVSFETFAQLQRDYKKCIEGGESHAAALRLVGFQPLAVYQGKLTQRRADGSIRQLRPILAREIGIRPNGAIVRLQDRMPGDLGTIVVGAHRGRPQE